MTKLRSILSYICCCFGRGSPIKEDDGYTPPHRKQRPYWQFNPSSRLATSLFAETYIPTPNQSVNRNTNITTDIHTRRNTDQDVDQFLVDFPYEFDSTDANRIQSTQRRIPSVSSIQDTRHLHQHRRLEHHQTKTFTQPTEGINPPKTDTPRQINTEQHTCSQNEIDPTTIDLPQLSHHSIPSISGKQEARNVHRYQQYSHDQPNLNQKSTERTDTIKIATSKKKHTDPDTYLEYKSNQTLNNRGESSHHPIPSLSGKQDTLNQHQNLQYEQNQSNKKIQPIERQDTLKTDAFKKEQIDPDTDSYSGFNPTVIDSKPSSHHSISSISRKQETQNVHHYQQYGHDQSNHIKLAIATTGSQKTDTSKKKYKNTDLDSKLNQIVDNRTESRNLATSSISGKQNICSRHQHQQHKHDQISKYIEPEERVDTFKTEVSKKKQIDQDTDSQHSFSRAITNRTESHRSIPSVSGKEDPDNMHQQYEDNQSNHIKQSTGTTDTLKIDASEKKYKNPDTDSDSILDQNVKKIYLTESSLPIYSMSAKQDILSLHQNQQYGYNQTNVSIESVYQYIIDNVEISTSEDSDENRDSNDGFNRTVINRPDSPQQQVPLTLHGQDTNDLHQSHYCKQNQTNPTKEPAGRIDTLKVDVLEKADRDLDTDSHDGLFPAVVAHQQSQHPNPSILGIQDTRKLHHSDPDKQNLTTVITQPRDSPDTDATKTSTERDNCKEIDSSHATNQTVINRTKSPPEIQDSRHLDQPQQHQPNQTDRVIQPASKLDSPDSRQSQSIKRRQASTSSKYSNLSTPNRKKNYRRDPPINLSSTSTVKQDILAKLNITWNTNLQNNHFIRSKIRNLPQSYQDILTKIVKDCRRTIKNHLRPHWSAMVKRYIKMMEKDSKNKSSYDSSNTAVSKEADLEKMTLKSSLEVFIMQKIGFDKAIFSCFNKIINIYHNAHNKEIDLNDNQTIQDVIAKVNLEIDRICEGLPIYANRNEIQQRIKKHQTIIIKGQTGMCN